jgi:hypothetical protein
MKLLLTINLNKSNKTKIRCQLPVIEGGISFLLI